MDIHDITATHHRRRNPSRVLDLLVSHIGVILFALKLEADMEVGVAAREQDVLCRRPDIKPQRRLHDVSVI